MCLCAILLTLPVDQMIHNGTIECSATDDKKEASLLVLELLVIVILGEESEEGIFD